MIPALIVTAQHREERNTGSFNTIEIAVAADVIISKGRNHKVVLEGDPGDIEDIKTDVTAGTLKINHTPLRRGFKRKTTVYITTPALSGVKLSGSGHIKTNDSFSGEHFHASISGSGTIDLNLSVTETEMNISGSGRIMLSGKSNKADITISGSGDIEAHKFRVREADVNILGSGSCRIYASETVNARIMGSGNVLYAGDPKHVNSNTLGSGRIRKL